MAYRDNIVVTAADDQAPIPFSGRVCSTLPMVRCKYTFSRIGSADVHERGLVKSLPSPLLHSPR